MLVARFQAIAHLWGLREGLVSSDEFGMLFEKGSPLVACVNQALAVLRDDGTLDSIQQRWLSDAVGVTELTP